MNTSGIKKILREHKPQLSEVQKSVLWNKIAARTITPQPSPYVHFLFQKKVGAIMAAVVVLVSIGGTSVAAERSRPGDVLFPVEQALEGVRLALAGNDEKKALLQLQFAQKRLNEIRSLIDESVAGGLGVSEFNDASTTFRADIDVFLDVIIATVEYGGQRYVFEMDVSAQNDITSSLADRFALTEEVVVKNTNITFEDRRSRVSDVEKRRMSDPRVTEAVVLLERLLDEGDDATQRRFVRELAATLSTNTIPDVRIKDDRVEFRYDDDDDDEDERSYDDDQGGDQEEVKTQIDSDRDEDEDKDKEERDERDQDNDSDQDDSDDRDRDRDDEEDNDRDLDDNNRVNEFRDDDDSVERDRDEDEDKDKEERDERDQDNDSDQDDSDDRDRDDEEDNDRDNE